MYVFSCYVARTVFLQKWVLVFLIVGYPSLVVVDKMGEKPLVEFDLSCDLSVTWKQLWRDEKFYFDYLREQDDIDIIIGPWESENGNLFSFKRQVECSHPVKVSFPGTPSHTRCFRCQSMTLSNNNTMLVMNEIMRFEGIPYSDYFTVKTKWSITEHSNSINYNPDNGDERKICSVRVYVNVEFQKSTWLKGTISSNTESEAKEGLELWSSKALKFLTLSQYSKNQQNGEIVDGVASWFSSLMTSTSPRHSTQSLQSLDIAKGELSRTSSYNSVGGVGDNASSTDWDSDSEFFDVEFTRDSDAGFVSDQSSHSSTSNFLRSPAFQHQQGHYIGGDYGDEETRLSTGKVLREALVVVLQFVWWRIRSASVDTWGPLFAPDPPTVVRRLIKTLAPITLRGVDFDCGSGSHETPAPTSTSLAILTSNPDLFVPTMLFLTLAQVLLWCIDVTGRPGHVHCQRETLLSTVLLVSLSTWVGASLWYHLVSYLLGSRLEVLQSFTVVGYGLIGTCVSLVASQLLVLLEQEVGHGPVRWASINPEWGLFAFGVPSGIALAIVFSQSTPTRKIASRRSSSTSPLLRTRNNSNESHIEVDVDLDEDDEDSDGFSPSPSPVRKVRAVARRTKRTAAWCWPKALCFLVVLITHLELLRYIHHVVIPGEQKLCAVWSNMRPEEFARFDYTEFQKLAHTIKTKAPFKF